MSYEVRRKVNSNGISTSSNLPSPRPFASPLRAGYSIVHIMQQAKTAASGDSERLVSMMFDTIPRAASSKEPHVLRIYPVDGVS